MHSRRISYTRLTRSVSSTIQYPVVITSRRFYWSLRFPNTFENTFSVLCNDRIICHATPFNFVSRTLSNDSELHNNARTRLYYVHSEFLISFVIMIMSIIILRSGRRRRANDKYVTETLTARGRTTR